MKKIFIILFCLLITSPAYAGTTPLFDLWKFFKKGKIVKKECSKNFLQKTYLIKILAVYH